MFHDHSAQASSAQQKTRQMAGFLLQQSQTLDMA
jgi:hypothetical protein